MAFKSTKKEQTQAVDHEIKVNKAKEFDNGIMLTLTINGVQIYGAWYRTYQDKQTGEDRDFIAFPSRKADNGKYYNHVYARLSDADMRSIEKQLEELLK